MVVEADRIRQAIRANDIGFVVCDSVAYACNGAPEQAEFAQQYFRAVRSFGSIASLHIAHVVKERADDKSQGQKPFGSIFWHNSARSTWFVKRVEDAADKRRIVLGLYNQKVNLGPKESAVGLAIEFGRDRTEILPTEIADVQELASGLSIDRRLPGVLQHGARTLREIANELDEKPGSVKKALERGQKHKHKYVLITDTPDRVQRWGLADRRHA